MRCTVKSAVFVCISAVLFSSGCAFKVFVGPSSGRSAEYQLTVAKAAEAAFEKLDLGAARDRKVFVEVRGLNDKAADLSSEEGYTRGLVLQKLFEAGAEPVEDVEKADVRMIVRQRIAGIDIVERHLPGIYYRVSVRGILDAHVVMFDRKTGSVIDSRDVHASAYYTEVYWFYVFGPARDIIIEDYDDSLYGKLWKEKERMKSVKKPAGKGGGE